MACHFPIAAFPTEIKEYEEIYKIIQQNIVLIGAKYGEIYQLFPMRNFPIENAKTQILLVQY